MERPSRARRAAFAAVLAVLVWAALEFFASAALWIRDGRRFSPARAQAQRDRVLAQKFGWAQPLVESEVPDFVKPDVLHPYLGFVNATSPGHGSPLGFPSPDAIVERRGPDRLVVAIVGGSVAQGFGEWGGPVLAGALGEAPALAGRRVVLQNFGLGGFKQPQQLLLLNYLLTLGAELDVLVNLDGFNEVALHEPENGKKGVTPSYPRSWYFRVVREADHEALTLIGRGAYAADAIRANAALFSRGALRYSPLGHLIWDLRHRLLSARAARLLAAVRQHRPTPESTRGLTGPPFDAGNEAALYAELAAIWARGSLQLELLSRANGIRYYHFLQPNQYTKQKPMGPEELARSYDEGYLYRPGVVKGYPLLVAQGKRLAEQGVHFTDLSGAFADRPEWLYTDPCCHFNRQGHEILAQRIAAAILEDLERDPPRAAR
jgi:hypothetical protein